MTAAAEIQEHQESAYADGYDYRDDAPHLKHSQLYGWFKTLLREELRRVTAAGLPPTVLEIGAGDGAFAEPLLATGASVTATEMSRPSANELRARYGTNPSFEVIFDPDGTLAPIDGRRFSIVLYASVLHHIPDYATAIEHVCDRTLPPGGTLLTFQDPLWYPSLRPGVRLASEATYLAWRLTRGNLRRGLSSRVRRARDDLRADEASDMVEYHVVRSGVNHEEIGQLLKPRFEAVTIVPYWSAHAPVWQKVGERLRLQNTFAIRAQSLKTP